ncbi:MAG: capsular biosynthesis protein [Betaproteobacteria bacterium]|nr:capsular biosynthesis protein [Betaproteobacteria bacterium]
MTVSPPPQQLRHVVFLQGMPAPFYQRVAKHLSTRGWRITRINLCAGDWLFWRGDNTIAYRGSVSQWPAFITRFMVEEGVTDLIVLGENRRYHREAVDIALAHGVRVTVNDFGYIRPDWITFERNGMSGASQFPRDPEAIHALAAQAPEVDWTPRHVDSAYRMARGDLLHNMANLALGWMFPRYRRSDLRPHTLIYTAASGLRLLTNRLGKARTQTEVAQLIASAQPYFLFPLQLNFDFQIVAYSPFDGVADSIHYVLRSFALHAAPDALLVVKEHPWDPALKNWAHVLQKEAATLGIAHRVRYLRGGHLDSLITHAQGVVTVNSTTGMRALHLGRPLQVLGQAVFDVAGLTHQNGLDNFWRNPTMPDAEFVRAFLKALAGTIQIRGVFFEESGLSLAAQEAAHRLLTDRVGQIVPGPPSVTSRCGGPLSPTQPLAAACTDEAKTPAVSA